MTPHPAATRIDITALSLAYGRAPLFDRLDLSVAPGEVLCLLGPSGAGKSTLLRAMAGLVRPEGGSVVAGGAVALMTQDDALLPWARVVENVVLGARLRGERPDVPRAEALLHAVGVNDLAKRPDALSGGMRKRVALAWLLYEDRPIALLDEPFAALDAITRRSVQALTLQSLIGCTVVLVTHDPFEALAMGTRIVVLAGVPARIALDERLPPAPLGTLRDPADPDLRPAYLRILAALEAP
ncbi:Taurine import ATP-binding protein TauB [Alphaproteobacteria bacterium SO-S41]|nr:Taurine import ATP-binding protein TauB [Alphaproteobacteria bacterium SO-S41]